MLSELKIRNLAVVEDVTLTFDGGLNVLTGSTGAGKSLILSAVNLLLGERASARVIRAGEDRAVVEGAFALKHALDSVLLIDTDADMLHIRREVTRNGRSSAYLNGRSCTVKQLQEVVHQLIEPHGQNEQLRLRDPENHIIYLDSYRDHSGLLRPYQQTLEVFREANRELKAFEARVKLLAEKKELLEHRIEEVDRAAIEPGEKASLEEQVRILDNGQEIFDALTQACEASEESEGSATSRIAQGLRGVDKLRDLDPRFAAFAEQLSGAEITLRETAADMRRYLDGLDFDPARLQQLQERFGFILELERRYQEPIEAVLEKHETWKTELESIAFEDEERDRLSAARAAALDGVKERALALRKARMTSAAGLDKAITRELATLAMPGAVFRTDVGYDTEGTGELDIDGTRVVLSVDGIDRVRFFVQTNPGESEGPMVEVASGGELSRIALALKKVTSIGREGSVLVLDELDSGIGADLGDMIADKLAALSERYQIICITHMAQIAARGGHHLVVRKQTEKTRTFTTIDTVDGDARRQEIARMLGGEHGSDKRLALAGELLRSTRP